MSERVDLLQRRSQEATMKWYVAVLVVRCRVMNARKSKPLLDRQIKVLKAKGPESAFQKAMKLGAKENHSYENAAGETVRWEFVGLADLDELLGGEIKDGTEIYNQLSHVGAKAKLTRPKQKLTTFWFERNKHKTAAQFLSGEFRDQAPR